MRLDVSPVHLPDEQASSFSRSVAPSSSGTDVPYYRLTKMRFAYKNNKNPCGSKILCTLFAILVNIVDTSSEAAIHDFFTWVRLFRYFVTRIMVALPPLPIMRLILLMGAPASILIIDAHDRSGERGDLSEADEQGLMDLSLRVDKDSAKEEYESAKGEYGGSE
jgi:hypothetical protein